MATHRGPTAGIHHVMNRGVDRQTVFFSDADRLEFGRRLYVLREQFEVETLAYCLMDNHYHLLLNAPAGNLSEAMQHLGSVFVRRTNARIGRDGPMFRSRFHSIPVTTDAYLHVAARYIHRNPRDVAGVHRLADYRWSSYRTYLGLRPAPSFLRTDLLIGAGRRDDVARLASFTESGDASVPPETLAALLELIALESVFIDHSIGVDEVDGSRTPHERVVLTLLVDWLPADLAADVERHLDVASPMARRRARSRATNRYAVDLAVRAVVDRVRVVLAPAAAAA